jgi:hypothetical protein
MKRYVEWKGISVDVEHRNGASRSKDPSTFRDVTLGGVHNTGPMTIAIDGEGGISSVQRLVVHAFEMSGGCGTIGGGCWCWCGGVCRRSGAIDGASGVGKSSPTSSSLSPCMSPVFVCGAFGNCRTILAEDLAKD